jgi:hypothetical protein
VYRLAGMGHLERLLRPRQNGRCRLGLLTSGGPSGNEQRRRKQLSDIKRP